ncbi:hypothetical protein [Phytohabitans kaempferiae]|uniref:Cas3 C-terminal domain-containing protein n=1 Tax=Phytohabitans kaempferiae TaxID=1620943 RepID=A0ABV6M3G5_9ACTN
MTDDAPDYMPGSGIDVVVLRAVGNQVVPVVGETLFDLDATQEPTQALLSELLGSTVRVTTAEGVPHNILAVLEDIPVPPAFLASPWLAASHPVLVRSDGTGRIGDLPVRYSDDRGLQILYPDPEDRDDEWDG